MKEEKDEENLILIDDDSNKIIEEENNGNENAINNQKDNNNNIDDENEELIKENKRQSGIKKDLIEVLQEVTNYLNKDENIPKSISEIYDIFIDNDFMTKSHLKEKVNECLLKFMFFVVGPAFGIIYLIGIFQIKALMNALLELIKKSFFDFLKCRFKEKCEITFEKGENVYDFYDYFYNYSINENIDFNLMMITGAIGNILIRWIGFKGSSGILCIFTFLSILWIINFDFNFKDKNVFDYDLLKILNILFIYLLLLIGIGGSSLLSHQILIESHLKYKNYLINKLRNDLNNNEKKEDGKMEELPDLNVGLNINNTVNERIIGSKKSLIQIEDISIDKDDKVKRFNTFDSIKKTNKQRQNLLEEKRLNKKEKNKFDFFFMICITTIFGYLGRYGMNILLAYILKTYIYNNDADYDKRVFMFCIMGLYAVSLIFAIIVYQIYKWSIFEYDQKNENKNKKTIKISQICGYIIYTETKNPKTPAKKNCCRLCCESQQNCCNETFCNLISIFGCSDDNPDCYCSCMCKQCKYNLDDYGKNKEVFRYCYKAERKCLWCNKFMTNDTQKRIFPFMIEYFILQLTTIGFEKHYEKYKNRNNNNNNNTNSNIWILVFIGTFIFFFYFTLSFARIFSDKDENDEAEEKKEDKIEEKKEDADEDKKEDKIEEKKEKEDKVEEKEKKNILKDALTKISNDILNGTHGIVLFNGVFSLIFSSFYLSKMPDKTKNFFFKENTNIIFIPILMNKFYYFTLNYYCIYTSEKNNKFDIISSSSLISFYIFIWNLALTFLKSSISDDYYNILYIIQIVFDSIPSLIVVAFILTGLVFSTGLIDYYREGCDNCEKCRQGFFMHKYLFCLTSFFLCFGGLWINIKEDHKFEYECCHVGDCCDIGDNCCNVYCFEGNMYCDCCCCSRNSSCFSDRCDKDCNTCKIYC